MLREWFHPDQVGSNYHGGGIMSCIMTRWCFSWKLKYKKLGPAKSSDRQEHGPVEDFLHVNTNERKTFIRACKEFSNMETWPNNFNSYGGLTSCPSHLNQVLPPHDTLHYNTPHYDTPHHDAPHRPTPPHTPQNGVPQSYIFLPLGSSHSRKRFWKSFLLDSVWAPIGFDKSRNVAGLVKSSSCKDLNFQKVTTCTYVGLFLT